MDVVLIILGVLFLIGGIAGCFLPVLPGPPLAFLALIFLQLTDKSPFSTKFLLMWAAIIAVVTLLDFLIPPFTTKRFGGSRYGVIGCTVGIIAGIFLFPPLGIVIFPFIGALIGEFIRGQKRETALRAAFGSFIGFLTGILLKLTVSIVMVYYFFTNI